MKAKNPFQIYGYAGEQYFCDRAVETEKMLDAIANDRNLTLIAPRRLGKTGLIHHVMHKLREAGDAKCVYLDIFAAKNQRDFVEMFAREVFACVESRMEHALKAAVQFVANCRPSLTINKITGDPTFSFSLDAVDSESTLRSVFEYLKSRKESIVIAIDEFQQVAEFPEKGTEALLRGYIQSAPNVRFIFAGSKLHMMREMFLSAKRPFYKSTQNLSLDRIDASVYYEFAASHFAAAKHKLSRVAFDFAYDIVDGVTWEMQSILNRLWALGEDIDSDRQVRAVLVEILNENSEEYKNIIAQLSANEAKILYAVAAAHRVKAITGAKFIAATGMSPSSIKQVADRLVGDQFLYQDESGYLVYDRFFSLWLKENAE